MTNRLSLKFLSCFIFIGITGFFLVTIGGSYLVEKHFEYSLSDALYKEANYISKSELVKNNLTADTMESLLKNLKAIDEFQDVTIWIINNNNEIILSTRREIPVDSPVPFPQFDSTQWGKNYYQTGNFYGYFQEPRLSVIAPITSGMSTKGYVAVHYQMKTLYQSRSNILMIMQLLYLIFFLLMCILFVAYRYYIHIPLHKILQGASEYAGGHLSYRIEVNTDDEMGYLANTLNYMSNELNKNSEYQRRFISDVSHDFRSPLTSIKGYVEAILDGTIPYEMQNKYLSIISSETDRLDKLTKSLLTLNELDIKKRMMHIQRFDINPIIKHTAEVFEGICTERKILLELLLTGRELFVMADVQQIQQVLYSLLDNAIKFSSDNSVITLETTEKNGKVFVSVKDHGTGIPKDNLSLIWNRFYKIDASRGKDRMGTGLGLSIVKEIINAHNQHIDVISTEGVGSEFIFTLEKAR